MTATRHSRDYDVGMFKPHGSADISFDGRIMRFESTGPFNAELVVATGMAMRDLLEQCPPQGPYFELIRVHRSALLAMNVLPALEKLVADLSAAGLLSAGTAIVDEHGLDGFKLMFLPYAAVYAGYGHPILSFTDYAGAEAWIEGQLPPPRT